VLELFVKVDGAARRHVIITNNESKGTGSRESASGKATEFRPEILWVRSFLKSYCGPGQHDFLFVTPRGLAWCSNCFKEQPAGGTVCLICDSPAAEQVSFVDSRRPEEAISGGACARCLAAFRDGAEFDWWRLAE
jgi:hypothetical protein